jgi:circadian clock protein KaiB
LSGLTSNLFEQLAPEAKLPRKTPSKRKSGLPQLSKGGEYKSTRAFEKMAAKAAATKTGDRSKYELRLYIAGVNPKSSLAIANVRRICEKHLAGRYELEVVDLYQNPVLSKGEQIVAVPTLIKKLPAPLRKFIGDMSDTGRILVGLDLRAKAAAE